MTRSKCILVLLLTSVVAAPAQTKFASESIPPERISAYADLAVNWMREYLQIDTSNPPGNEMRAVAWFKKILDEEGIENRAFEFVPGRGNIWARIPATTSQKKRPLILLKREKVALDRDVIFLATADEEVDDIGTDWMITNQRDLLGNPEFLIT